MSRSGRVARVMQALVGLAALQWALPKLLPLPGVSERWWLWVLGGGSWGRLATFAGGALVAAWGASLVPSGFRARQLAALSAGAAVGSRLLLLIVVALADVPVRWWAAGRAPGALPGLLLVALLYGGAALLLGWAAEAARAGGTTKEGESPS